MTKEELATKLNGREYLKEITASEVAEADKNNLVVVYGLSDDGIIIHGASNSVTCSMIGGGTVHIEKDGLVENECDDIDCPYFKKLLESVSISKIEAVWDPGDGLSWAYKTDIPHATFNVMEDGEVYCRGIVFSIDDVK